MTLDDILKKLQRGREISNNITKKTGDVLDSVGWGLAENIVKPITKATYKTIDNYSARKKALEEKNPNMSWLDKYIEIKKDTETDNINNLVGYTNKKVNDLLSYSDKKADELAKNNILRGILLGANKKVNNEQAARNIIKGGIIPNDFKLEENKFKLKDTIDERKYKSFTSEELQKKLDEGGNKVAPNQLARGIGNLAYEGVKMGTSMAHPLAAPVIYGTTGVLEEYGRTDDPDKIIASGLKDAFYGTIMRGTSNLAKTGMTKVLPNVGKKWLPTIVANYGSNYAGGFGASALTETGYDLITGEKINPKQILGNANKSGLMSGVIGGTTDTIRDVKLSKILFNKDVNKTIENLQNINKQITEGDVSISKNPKIINKLLEKGNKEIETLSNNNYLMKNKKIKETVDMLKKAYDTGHINDIKLANNNFTGLLGTAEMNLKSNVQNKNIVPVKAESNDINTFIKRRNNIPISEEVQVKSDVANFSNQIDNIDKIKENDSLNVLSKTPKVYQDLGLNDLPMTITKNHTLWSMEKQDGNTHRHNIEKEILKQIPEALTKPLNIVKSGSRNDSIVAITELSNSNGDLIVVPIKVDGRTTVNEVQIDANAITSIYGKDNDYDGWMRRNQEMGRILYDKDDGIIKKYRSNIPRLQLPNNTTSTNNIIPSNEKYVNNEKNNEKYSKNITGVYQKFLKDNFSNDGTKTYMKDVLAPVKMINKEKVKSTIPPITNEQLKNTFERNVDNALNNKSSKRNTILGKVKSNIALKIKDILGIDVSNRIHRLSDYDIRHMMNQHSDINKEVAKGQIPITSEDIKRIPDIIENPSDIVKGTDNKLGKTIRYIKEYNDNTTFVVEIVPENSNDLIIKTMWKKPSTLTNIENNPSSTSKTKGSDISSTVNNIIPSQNNYVNIAQNSQKNVKVDKLKENKTAIPISENIQLKNDIKKFAKQVDNVKNGAFPKRDMLTLLSNTPKVLQDIGLNNYPITMTQRHLDTIMNADGKYKNANYHNLGEDIVKQLPKAIANPLDIVHSNTDKNSIVLTTYLADKNNNTVIASIKIDGKGSINDIRIDTNVMTSAYGKENYDNFMHKNIRQGNLLYDVDQGIIKKLSGQGSNYLDDSTSKEASPVQQLTGYTSTINNIIPRGENYVNNSENNQKSLEKIQNDDINTFIKEENNQMKNSLFELKKVVPIKEKTKTAIPIAKNIKEISNLTNSNSIDYNTSKGIGDKNGRQRSSRNNEELRGQEQGRNKKDSTDSSRKETSSGYSKDNISQKTIGELLSNKEEKLKVIEYAKDNRITNFNSELVKINEVSKELGINLVLYNGKNGNVYVGLNEKNNIYLDVNNGNVSIEDGTITDRFYHEVLHFLKRNTSFNESIKELQLNIMENENEAINFYLNSKGYNSDNCSNDFKAVLTEEILADYCAKYMSGYEINYGLSEQTIYVLNQTVNDGLSELKLNRKNNLISKNNNTDINSFVKSQKTVIPISEEIKTIKRPNIIDDKVAEYVESVKDNFETNIDINTKVVNEGNAIPVDYKKEKQVTIYKRARDIFGKIGRKVFTNKNDSEKIYVSNTDINESIRKTVTNLDQKKYLDENMAVFSQLDKIIENGKEIGSSIQDTKGREYKDYKYYVTNARINGENCVIEYDTRIEEHNKINERHFRLERVYKVNEGDLVTGADKKSPNQFVPKSPSVNNIIQQDNNYVNSTENSQKSTKIDKLKENKTVIPFNKEVEPIQKHNIIDEKVAEYVESVKDNFETNIDINTKVVNEGNVVPVDYKKEKQATIYKRARDIFGKIGKKVFTNKNDSEKIYVSNTDINESIRKTITNPEQNKYLDENIAIFSQLDSIIENGKEISSSVEDTKGREYKDYKYYVTNARINGENCVIEYDTRVQLNADKPERHFRLERIYKINEGDLATGLSKNIPDQFGTKSPSINNIIQQDNNYVNSIEKSQKSTKIDKLTANAPFSPEFKAKQKKYVESVKKYNIDIENGVVKTIANMASQRGVELSYDDSVFKSSRQSALWRVNKETGKREVIINPKADSTRALQSIVVHEIVHDMENTQEYKGLSSIVLEYAKKQDNYDTAFKELSEMYAEEYKNYKDDEFNSRIEQEMVADVLGEKLGNQEFINNLTSANRNIAQKVYNWVVDKLNKVNKLIGYKLEKLYWADVKNKFEKAFDSEFNNNDGGTKFSIQTDTNGNKYIKVDTDQDIFEGLDKKDYSKVAKMYMQDYLMGKTQLSENDNAVIDRRSVNKYTNPGKKQQNFDKKMQLTPELKNILQIAEKDSVSAPSKENSKYRSWEYYKFNFELGGKIFEGNVNIGIDSNGNKHFYEINKIKEVADISGTSLNRSTTSINNIIPSNQKYVNNEKNNQKYSKSTVGAYQKFLKDNFSNNGTKTYMKDVLAPVKENKTATPISKDVQLKSDVANFSKQIDNIDKIKENDSLNVLSKTPKVYQDLGLNDLPMTITKNHTLWSMEKQDGNTHRHGIEKEILKQIPEALTKPLNIVKSGSRNDSIVVITELSNSNGDLIVVPIKIDGKSNVNQIEIDSNVLTSIYGKDNDYDGWMRRNQEMGRILYDKDDGIIKKYRDNPPRLQLPNDTISTINNIIPKDNNYVNSAQNSQKKCKS